MRSLPPPAPARPPPHQQIIKIMGAVVPRDAFRAPKRPEKFWTITRPSIPAPKALPVSSRVEVHSLKSRDDLNYRKGSISGPADKSGRYPVRLDLKSTSDLEPEEVSLKLSNLSVKSAESTPPPLPRR